jgi:hypothetical protein
MYCLDEEELHIIKSRLCEKQNNTNSLKVLLQVDSISLDDHYEKIFNLLKNRTSVGLMGENNSEKGTSVGLIDEINSENRTSVGLSDDNNSEKRTSVGLYDNLFNKFRYVCIDKNIMRTDVPFLELLILKHLYPYRLDLTTTIDEYYFNSNPQKQIHTQSIGIDGIEVCEVILPKGKIKEHFRAKTLGSMCIKLIFNNPFCHPDIIVKAVQKINDYYCEDPHPQSNPKPTDEEVACIVMNNYQKFINGQLDFSKVIRRNPRTKEISKKYVFRSKEYQISDPAITQLEAIQTYTEGKREQNIQKYLEAIHSLQDGMKITKKRIADYMGVSARNLRRIETKEIDELLKRYNKTMK